MTSPTVVWLRDDLRIADNPALHAAADRGGPVVALYIHDEVSPGIRPLGGAARWWLHGSLTSLAARLRERGIELVLRHGAAHEILLEIVADAGAGAVYWNRRYGAPERAVDAGLKSILRESGIDVQSFAASVLFEPWTVRTGAGTPFSVFTPFWRACLALPAPRAPLPEPGEMAGLRHPLASDELDDWALLPTDPEWAGGLRTAWEPGEPAAQARLAQFCAQDLGDYERTRDTPAADATSLLSPRLRWGELSPHQVWHATHGLDGSAKFLSEIGWREFAWHTLFHHPTLGTDNLRAEFDAFPWPPPDTVAIRAWERGRTGFALVDAGMRELWTTGVQHNRVRMVTASFLVKNLLVHWRIGEEWFWDTLVDADAASNPFNWQWVAGSGADAAPYFRVFNPDLQAAKFDPDREYVRRWAPDHLTDSPPERIVDLGETRRTALAAYETVTRARRG